MSASTPTLSEEIAASTGARAVTCYQCGKCSAGCPMAADSDLRPHRLMRLVTQNRRAEALADESIWLCLTCETCSVRCPNDSDPAAVIDALRDLAIREGVAQPPPRVGAFHHAFLDSIRLTGRLHEIPMVVDYKLRSADLVKDVANAPAMAVRGKVKVYPKPIKGHREVRRIFERCRTSMTDDEGERGPMTTVVEPTTGTTTSSTTGRDTVAYYPGCSLHGTAREYDESLRAVTAALGIGLTELDDWNCCGASSGHVTNHTLGVALPARNLALAEAQGFDTVLAPCAACFSRLAGASHEARGDTQLAAELPDILGREFTNTVEVRNVLQELGAVTDRITEKVAATVANPVKGAKVACYYGCLLARPPELLDGEDPEQPTAMDDLVKACGASPVAWNSKVECCGAAFSIARTTTVIRLGRAIIDDARRSGAEAIVVACPMCHSNLDLRQRAMVARGEEPVPVLFITQLVGLAMGLSAKELSLSRHFIDTAPLLATWTARTTDADQSAGAAPAAPATSAMGPLTGVGTVLKGAVQARGRAVMDVVKSPLGSTRRVHAAEVAATESEGGGQS